MAAYGNRNTERTRSMHTIFACQYNQLCSDSQGAVWVLFLTMNSFHISQFSCNIFFPSKLDTNPLLNQHSANLTLYVPCIMFQCVDKPTRCNTYYEWSLLSINWLYMFRTISSPSSGASSHKLYNTLQASLTVVWMYIHATPRLACTNIPVRYTVYEMMLLMIAWW